MSLIVGHTAGGEVGLGLLMDVAAEAGWPAGLLDDESSLATLIGGGAVGKNSAAESSQIPNGNHNIDSSSIFSSILMLKEGDLPPLSCVTVLLSVVPGWCSSCFHYYIRHCYMMLLHFKNWLLLSEVRQNIF